ncbi:MAG: hypothetical protein ABJF10_12815 [Chthoniobacter sp.]|uniref:hypothetical protein n=1 Tax=Chthoniobacter sp. TaxID=2510640 RepID=UPI0032A17EA1
MIHPTNWTLEQSKATLGALRSIATLHGTAQMSAEEAQLLEGVRINILHHPEITDAEQNIHIKPAELAATILDDEHKERAAQLIALMPYATRPYADNKTYISEKFIEALGENMHRMEDFLGARQKHSQNMEYCALRKMGRDIFPSLDPDGQYKELMKLLKDSEGDPEEKARYESLQGYPDGSLGKAFWSFYAQFDWPLPGDPLWISEDMTVRHDLIHVLCAYDISINGEYCVSGFSSGNSERFNWMIAMLGFTPPYVSTGAPFNPADFTTAYMRGVNASHSFVDNWDFWPVLEHQVGDLRTEYQI